MPSPSNKNLSLAINLLMVVIGMLALSYASVPLYRLFCKVTGYGGTTQESAHAPDHVLDREITVRFNADTDPTLPWVFKAGVPQIKVKVGQQTLTHFTAENKSTHTITGRAMYNVIPFSAGSYFVKIACFCFKEQTLQPAQKVNMPVLFYIDPSIADDPEMKNISTITLSYTFFPVKTVGK